MFDSNLTVIHFVSSITKEAVYFLDAITVVGNASDQESNLYQTLGVGVGAGVLLANVDQAKTVYSFVQVRLQFDPASNSIFITFTSWIIDFSSEIFPFVQIVFTENLYFLFSFFTIWNSTVFLSFGGVIFVGWETSVAARISEQFAQFSSHSSIR